MATIRVHTTQNVTLEYEVASIGDRILATLIDYLVLLAWVVLMAAVVYAIGRGASGASRATDFSRPAEVIGMAIVVVIGLIMVVPVVFYNLLCEVFLNGQSIGKKARDLRVIRLDGTTPSLGAYFLRWLLRLVEFSFGYGLIAVIAVAASGKGQRLGDMAAGTSVIRLRARPSLLPDLGSLAVPEGYQPVFPQAANLSDHDIALLRQLVGRGLQQKNYVLLHETATKIKELLHVQSDLSDEVFLRTVLRDHAHVVATS